MVLLEELEDYTRIGFLKQNCSLTWTTQEANLQKEILSNWRRNNNNFLKVIL